MVNGQYLICFKCTPTHNINHNYLYKNDETSQIDHDNTILSHTI